MKVPVNWIKDYVKLPKDRELLTHKLTMAGHMLDKVEQVDGETVYDLELRGNRADCYSILGIAREVAALFNTPLKTPKSTNSYKKVKSLKGVKLTVKSAYAKRVMMVVIKDVTITESPKWLTSKLKAYGVPSINNIVDLTNFVAIETGQPSHAFDLEKTGNKLSIELAKKGETMTTFMGDEITLTEDDLVWRKDKEILSIAGAIGSKNHSISKTTKTVLLEAANYDRANIRRSVHRHNLLTDAGIRHEKELDPNLVEDGMARLIYLITENKWGKVEREMLDHYPKKVTAWNLSLSYDYLAKVAGFEIKESEIKKILKGLNFQIVRSSKTGLTVKVPTYRTDVVLEEDLIEEILRIYGYDKIPVDVLSLEIPKEITPAYLLQEQDVKEKLLRLGFSEIITLPFVKPPFEKYNTTFEHPKAEKVMLLNRPSHDFEILRTTMFPNLMEITQKIENERGESAMLFEVGKTYYKKKKEYVEERKLGIMYWTKKQKPYRVFKGYLDGFFTLLGLVPSYEWNDTVHTEFGEVFTLALDKKTIGNGGMIGNTYFVEINLDTLLMFTGHMPTALWPQYPPQIEDITLTFVPQTYIGEVVKTIESSDKTIKEVQLVDVYKNAYTFRLWYQHQGKTLSDQEVTKVRDKLLNKLKTEFGAKLKD